MCGRYRRTTSEEELARRYHIPIPPERDLPISWDIAPTQDVFCDPTPSRDQETNSGHFAVGSDSELGQRSKKSRIRH
jgi:putative SOS response-associated peptidase YedK